MFKSTRNRFCHVTRLIVLISGAVLAVPRAPAGDCTVTPSPFWKNTIAFPDDPFRAESPVYGEPGWVKFTLLTCDPTTAYFQDSQAYPFHYEFATQLLDPFIGMSLEDFNSVTLFNSGREAVLGAVVLPPLSGWPPPPEFPEYGIQLIGQDPLPVEDVIDYFDAVRASVSAGPGVQAFYFPTFEQLDSALANADASAANGILISSPARWSDGHGCYAHGWALGRLKFFAADAIEDAFLTGQLQAGDILLTDAVPASIPLVAGIVTLSPATPSSHVAILASTFQVPFVYLAGDGAQQAQDLQGHLVVLRSFEDIFGLGGCRADLIDVEDQLGEAQVEDILALKAPPPLNIQALELSGAYAADVDDLSPDDIRHFGGKAANFGFLRRAIPDSSPKALALSFDLWTEFLNQTLGSGTTLREHIAVLLGDYSYPPADMLALADDLDDIRDLIRDEDTAFTPAQQAAIIATLQDPQYGLDISRKIRFRSSTNVEDSEQFTGAGLYDSRSGCLLDDLDGDDVGPSLCDPAEDEERGVFRAIRRVFRSFYNDNAFLERLRHGVDPDDVGMAILVHHSFPDAFELANGVATYSKTYGIEMTLVSQIGAHSVTNPDPGTIPEVVDVTVVGGTSFWPSLRTSSNLVLLGDTVMDWLDDYIALSALLKDAADQFELETGKSTYVLDFEYKKLAPGGAALPAGGLVVKQIREIPQPDTTPKITPFLVNQPTAYIVLQGHSGDVFSNHRLKVRWLQETHNMWLDPVDLANTGIFADTDITYFDGCALGRQHGMMSSFPAYAHDYAEDATTDVWRLPDLPNPRDLTLTMDGVGLPVSAAQSPILTISDVGFAGSGTIRVQVDYDEAVLAYVYDWQSEQFVESWRMNEEIYLRPRFTDTADAGLYTHVFDAPLGATITTSYYLKPVDGFCAGCIFPLSGWEQTVIEGLTTEPIVLTSDWAQTYEAGQHNFSEWFLFEPRLDPEVTTQQRQELALAGIDQIVVFSLFGDPIISYISREPCACTVGTGVSPCADIDGDGVRDDNCVWWACAAGSCESSDIGFADMGGPFGDCRPDGAADGHDRFHALNCFSNSSTTGSGSYPCEPAPPQALNVDAGGPFGSCIPDGVCDGHDAFHALNAFDGSATCVCPTAPQPRPGGPATPIIVGRAGLTLRAESGVVSPGVTFDVHVFLDDALPDLRGYQLHVGVHGGQRGALELVDIAMDESQAFSRVAPRTTGARGTQRSQPARPGGPFAASPYWQAFNVPNAQMVAGLDGPGIQTAPRTVLATFTFRATAGAAAGTFTVTLLHDEQDASQRTFLFPTPANGRIAIRRVDPAVLMVAHE